MSQDGVIVVVVVSAKGHSSTLASGPDIISRGFTFMKEAGELVDGAKEVVTMALEAQLKQERWEWRVLRGTVYESLSNYCWEKTRRRPMILPVLLQL